MNTPPAERDPENRLSLLINVTALTGAIAFAAMSMTLLLVTLLNAPAIVGAERRSMDIVLGSLQDPVELTILLPALGPIIICVIAFVLVIGGVVLLVFTDAVQNLAREIFRLSALCPTLPFFRRLACNTLRNALIVALLGIFGLFATSVLVVAFNVLILIPLAGV